MSARDRVTPHEKQQVVRKTWAGALTVERRNTLASTLLWNSVLRLTHRPSHEAVFRGNLIEYAVNLTMTGQFHISVWRVR